MRFHLLMLFFTALLVAVAVELVKADSTITTAVVDTTEITTMDMTRLKQQTTTTRRLGGDDDGVDDDGYCCLERETSCEPATDGKDTVCRSYCAVPCGGDDDDDDDNFPYYPSQCFPTYTKANSGCDCDCVCCIPPPHPPVMPPYRGKGYHNRQRRQRQLGKGHYVPIYQGPPVSCKCSCNGCGGDDDYYY